MVWSGLKAFNLTLITSLILGFAFSLFTGETDGASVIARATYIFTVASVFYQYLIPKLSPESLTKE
jgi:hypothetical protein